jgi:hypothetical protein
MSSAVRRMMTICHQCQNSTEISLNQEESVTLSPQMVVHGTRLKVGQAIWSSKLSAVMCALA